MSTTTLMHYEGPPELAYALVRQLEDAGLDIQWVPPPEERAPILEAVEVAIIARGSYDLLAALIGKAIQRYGKKIKVTTEDSSGSEAEIEPERRSDTTD